MFRLGGQVLVRGTLLKKFKDLYGHLCIPQKFVIPENDPNWPEKFYNYSLGAHAHLIRKARKNTVRKTLLLSDIKKLDEIGFIWNAGEYRQKLNLQAFEIYKKLFQKDIVEKNFIIPFDDNNWPKELWGFHLGNAFSRIKYRKKVPHCVKMKPVLKKMKFDMVAYFEKAACALQVFFKLRGHVHVPVKFVVPMKSIDYPEETWGLQLGAYMKRLYYTKSNGAETRKMKLRELGLPIPLTRVPKNKQQQHLKILIDKHFQDHVNSVNNSSSNSNTT
mmetsp:Transcript_1618/g.2245  ORF Transcript_1618/g.2245 Transcript_1618/m.2245 type:complete len:275 (-) Transcript_1618:444-1268(-)